MSIFGALIAGVSGIRANAQSLATISDNIANVQTVGYKRVETRFSTLVTASSRAVHSPGGVRSNPFQLVEQAGLLLGTTFETDLAIDGDGFFAASDVANRGPGDEFSFTRAGSFRPDENGDLINNAGYFLQAWQLDANGNLPTGSTELISLNTVNIANITGSPVATSDLFLGATLDSQATPGTQVTSSVTIFDSLGTPQDLRVTWVKGDNANEWFVAMQAGNAPNGISSIDNAGGTLGGTNDLSWAPPTPSAWAADPAAGAVDAMKITFASDGSISDLEDWSQAGTPSVITAGNSEFPVTIDFSGSGASNAQIIQFDLGSINNTNGVNQFAVDASNPVRTFTQDGLAFGTAIGISINNEGTIEALFDNGEKKAIYRIPIVSFANPNALEAVSGNAYQQTSRSGDFVLREAGTGGVGQVVPFSLEGSTVDIADEFSNMIVTQRSYSANTRVINTADEMLDELIRVAG